jgi:hypothetical protein
MTVPWRSPALGLAGGLMAAACVAPARAGSVNACIDSCYSTYQPPADCPSCTGSRDRCVEACSKTAYSYGAIAYGSASGAWGTSYQWQSRSEAEREAMSRCSQHGDDCQVAVWFEHNCGAVVTARGGDVFWGLGDGEGAARANARDKCLQGGGEDCQVQVSACSR